MAAHFLALLMTGCSRRTIYSWWLSDEWQVGCLADESLTGRLTFPLAICLAGWLVVWVAGSLTSHCLSDLLASWLAGLLMTGWRWFTGSVVNGLLLVNGWLHAGP